MSLPVNNAITFINAMKKAKQAYDMAMSAKTAWETYQKYKWTIEASKKLYGIYKHIVPTEEMHPHMSPWFTVDLWNLTFGRKQAKERGIKAKYKEKFLPTKGKPLKLGEETKLGRRQ